MLKRLLLLGHPIWAIALLLLSISITLLTGTPSYAQVPSLPPPPYNVDLGALITNTARGASTANSSSQNNLANEGVICTYNQTAHGGTPSTTIGIQIFDAASSTWQTLVTSGAITADNTPTSIVVAPGIQTTTTGQSASLPAGMVVMGLRLPRVWRVTETVAGTGTPTVTGTIGCNTVR